MKTNETIEKLARELLDHLEKEFCEYEYMDTDDLSRDRTEILLYIALLEFLRQ